MEDKRPVKFVVRRIFGFENFAERVIARFVSKAYLVQKEQWWGVDGSTSESYFIEFCDECFSWGEWVDKNLWVEAKDTQIDSVFDDYASCKKYVDEMNKSDIKYKLDNAPSKQAFFNIMNKAKDGIAFGKVLEEKFISEEERKVDSIQTVDENC